MSEYHWTPDQCDQLHPYYLLVALGWKPKESVRPTSKAEQARKMVEEKRERDKARGAPQPRYKPKQIEPQPKQ